jgi:hypothetical protein
MRKSVTKIFATGSSAILEDSGQASKTLPGFLDGKSERPWWTFRSERSLRAGAFLVAVAPKAKGPKID